MGMTDVKERIGAGVRWLMTLIDIPEGGMQGSAGQLQHLGTYRV